MATRAAIQLAVTEHSSATSTAASTVVFIHGLLGSATNFRSIATAKPILLDTRRIISVDLANHGRSPHVAGRGTLDDLAVDVAATLEKHGATAGAPLTLVGHSLGGKVASLVALRYAPPSLRRLVVMDIAPVPYSTRDAQWRAVSDVVAAAAATDATQYRVRGDVDRVIAGSVPDAGMRSFVLQNLLVTKSGTYEWRCNLPALQSSLPAYADFPSGVLPSTVETHFIRGERSNYILPTHHGAIARLFTGARLHTVANAGHWLHADQPGAFVALLAKLLDGGGQSTGIHLR